MARANLGFARIHRDETDLPDEGEAKLEIEELKRIARATGARVLQTNVVNANGKRTAVVELDIPGNAKAIVYLSQAARLDARHPTIRPLALSLRRENPDPEDFGRAVQRYVREHVIFVLEVDEVFQSAAYTLRVGAGDCDDHARCVCALALAGGCVGSKVVPVYAPNGKLGHVCAQIRMPSGAMRWAETTVAADWGEEPYAAVRRLGLAKHRTDITGGA
jgi:hypothetical protein